MATFITLYRLSLLSVFNRFCADNVILVFLFCLTFILVLMADIEYQVLSKKDNLLYGYEVKINRLINH